MSLKRGDYRCHLKSHSEFAGMGLASRWPLLFYGTTHAGRGHFPAAETIATCDCVGKSKGLHSLTYVLCKNIFFREK